MPSQHSKPVKEDESDYEDDKKSLTSIVKDNKKGPTNATNSTNSRLKLTRPKKEDDGDDHLPITSCLPSHPSESKLKKEDDVDDVSLGFLQKRKAAKANSGSQSKQARVKKEENDFDHGDDKSTVKKSSVPPNADKKKIEKEKTKVAAESSVKKESEQSVKKEKKLSEQSVKTQKKMSEQNGKNQKKVSEQILKGKKMSGQTVKKEKKVYALPGQKRDPPEERDPLRIFYETLYEQLPESEMAQFWMMESGLLSEAEAKKIYEKKQKSKLQKTGTPKKATVSVERSTKSVTVKKQILSSPVSSNKKNTSSSKVAVKGSKKRSIEEESSENEESSEDESEDDFVMPNRKGKKQKVV